MAEATGNFADLQRKAINDFRLRHGAVQARSVPPGLLSPAQIAELMSLAEESIFTLEEGLRMLGVCARSDQHNVQVIHTHFADMEQCLLGGQGIRPSVSDAAAIQQGLDRLRERLLSPLFKLGAARMPNLAKGGRPQEYDWRGVLIHLIAVANTPDGLPDGRGAQTRIAEMMDSWFMNNTPDGASPAHSVRMEWAKRILNELSR